MEGSSSLARLGWKEKLDIITQIRNQKEVKPEIVLKLGSSLLKKHSWSLGSDYWDVCEDVFYASLDTLTSDWTQFCIKALRKQFGSAVRVMRMEGILYEHTGKFNEALKIYEEMLTSNPLDQLTWKRKISLFRTTGRTDDAISSLNNYLEIFQADLEAWEELTDIYLSVQHFSQAAFCYEEILLNSPEDCWVLLKFAEILQSIGNLEKALLARKYFIQAIVLNQTNSRAMWGLYQCCNFIKSNKPDEVNSKIFEKVKGMLLKIYQGSPILIGELLR